jgi:hypothetical protein
MLMVVVGAAAMLALTGWASRGSLGGWTLRQGLWRSLAYGQFRLFLLIGLSAVLALAGMVAWLLRHGLRRRMSGEAGTAIIEFVLILPILLFIALVLIQSSLLMGGFVSVNYASYAAARGAIVMVPAHTVAEPRNVIVDTIGPGGSPKVDRIWQAAVWPLLPTGDGGYENTGQGAATLTDGLDDLLGAYGMQLPAWADERLSRKLAYAQDHTQVELAPPDNGDTYGDNEDIRIEVRHDLYLSIPYAAKFFAAIDSDRGVDLGGGKHAVTVTVQCRLTNEGRQDNIEEETLD